jgi:transcriptional regulator with XRE-family HTH domain
MAETFADRLVKLREAKGLTRYRVAVLAGLTHQTMANLEHGSSQPTWDTVQRLAIAIGCGVQDFIIKPVLDTKPVKKRKPAT